MLILDKCLDVSLFINIFFLFYVNVDFIGCWWEDRYFI